ncbi:MAG: DUF2892 domain-containing protein [Verrucomicrobiota bacterium]
MADWKCNIGRSGRIIRGVIGLIAVAAGVYLLVWRDEAFWSTGLIAIGLFGIFEAVKGWCALRAVGFKTPF